MEDGDDEDDDVDQQEPLPRLTTYKEAITALKDLCYFFEYKGHGDEALSVDVSSNIDKIVMHLQDKQHCVTALFSS